ncbi:hypothetical protein JCM19240_5689 [Vibrio maritimus]|uniref:Uncharacterized protein n=1 Tax=Vibrio maritimus TaxID=990268 RepID=A0A090SZ79_9VIBR|nr:hypothetical protein JCM19240_5689 [Vibrio maritimus]
MTNVIAPNNEDIGLSSAYALAETPINAVANTAKLRLNLVVVVM